MSNFRKHVGPIEIYHQKGMLQFLICLALGLQRDDDFLDIGCGSLRAGRWFIPYLNEDRYCGLETVRRVTRAAIGREIGRDLVEQKRPSFAYNATFDLSPFDRGFDMMLCHAVMIHIAKPDLVRLFDAVAALLKSSGLFVGNYQVGKDFKRPVAKYPQITRYRPSTIMALLEARGLKYTPLELVDLNRKTRWFVASPTEFELLSDKLKLVKNIDGLWRVLRKKM